MDRSHIGMRSIQAYLEKQSPAFITIAAIVGVLLLGGIDFVSGYEISFSIFYLGPIMLVGWLVGRRAGMLVSVISAVVWLVADVTGGHTFTHPLIPFWNAVVRLGFFTIVVIMLSRLKVTHDAQETLIGELREAMDNIKVLSGLVPICAWCKKVRDDEGYWQQVEAYVASHSDATFTHAICPECLAKMEQDLPPV
jgi:hypothetical protein